MTELLGITIAVSLRQFRRKVSSGKEWNFDCKFSACNYFIGRCLLSFPSEHRRWAREQDGPPGSPRHTSLKKAEKLAATDTFSYPADLAADRDLVRIVFRQADYRTRQVLMGILYGHSPSIIATETRTSVREVELLIERHRENVLSGTVKDLEDYSQVATSPFYRRRG
ncbi:hypothetical protein [Streptomyces noursei]|uniref:hypothetical protein n=1 Tax=Streptomyces noursei TaxID=1971 RepID=UPI0011AF3511|nr:hypothetical protein [Streptomyces noursei]